MSKRVVFIDGPLRGWAWDVHVPEETIVHHLADRLSGEHVELIYLLTRTDSRAAYYTLGRTQIREGRDAA